MSSGAYTDASSVNRGGGRAFRPGPRAAFAAAAVMAMAVVAVLILSGGSGSGPAARVRASAHGGAGATAYGHIPSWLPDATPKPVRLVRATAADPDLQSVEGYTVQAELPHGSVDVTAVGPAFPSWVSADVQSGHWSPTQTVPTTFDVTLADPRGAVPLRPGSFTVLTNTGQILTPKVSMRGGGRVPTVVRPGRIVSLRLSVPLMEGDGTVRWAPVNRNNLIAWEWTLELD